MEPQQAGSRVHTLPAAPNMPSELLLHILSHLPPNAIACTARVVCKQARTEFSGEQHRLVRLSRPLPDYAVSLARYWEEGVRGLTSTSKLLLFSTAAASGCEANLDLVLHLLQPSLYPELLRSGYYRGRFEALEHEPWCVQPVDPGSVAARHGHPHLLPYLLSRGVPLVPRRTLEAVAQHCDLGALQAAWELLPLPDAGSGPRAMEAEAAADMAAAHTAGRFHPITAAKAKERMSRRQLPVAVPPSEPRTSLEAAAVGAARAWPPSTGLRKLEWLAAQPQERRASEGVARVWGVKVAAAAAAEGHVRVLEACRAQGDAWRDASVLAAALQHAPLAVADWLERRGGLLPGCWAGPEQAGAAQGAAEEEQKPGRRAVYTAALLSGDVDKLQWVVRRLPPAAAQALAAEPAASEAAAASGSVPLLRHLAAGGQLRLGRQVMAAAVRAGKPEAAQFLAAQGCPIDSVAASAALDRADAELLAWTLRGLGAQEAQCVGFRAHWLPPWVEPHADGSCSSRRPTASFPQLARLLRGVVHPSCFVHAAVQTGQVAWLEEQVPQLGARWWVQFREDHLKTAVRGGSQRMLEQVTGAKDYSNSYEKTKIYTLAAALGDRATLEGLVRGGVGSKAALREGIRQRAPLCTLRHMVALGVGVSKGARRAAGKRQGDLGGNSGVREYNAGVVAWMRALPAERDDTSYDDDYGRRAPRPKKGFYTVISSRSEFPPTFDRVPGSNMLYIQQPFRVGVQAAI